MNDTNRVTLDDLDLRDLGQSEVETLTCLIAQEEKFLTTKWKHGASSKKLDFACPVASALGIMREVGITHLTKHNKADLHARAGFMGTRLLDSVVELLVGVRFKNHISNVYWGDFVQREAAKRYKALFESAGGPLLVTWFVDEGDEQNHNFPERFAQHQNAEDYVAIYGVKELDPQMTGYVILRLGLSLTVFSFKDDGVGATFQYVSADESEFILRKLGTEYHLAPVEYPNEE